MHSVPQMHSRVEPLSTPAYPRGSEWRRWDLHVHTPCSVLNNGFDQDFEAYASTLFTTAVARGIAVVGVTDYFSADGYKRLKEIQGDQSRIEALLGEDIAEKAARILLLPNIELRLSDIVQVGGKSARINAHVLFSETVSIRDIEENFLHRLEFPSSSSPGGADDKKTLTRANLEEFGARLKAEHAPFAGKGDLEVGMDQAVVSREQIGTILQQGSFARRHLFVVVADEDLSQINWDSQAHNARKLLIQKSHMLFSASPGTRSFGLGLKSESVADFELEFHGRKPCIHGSDAHDEDGLFVFSEDRQLWVRADPTFDGLTQLLHEPADRVFIGPEPPEIQRIRTSATKSIDGIDFVRDEAAAPDARWFSGSIPLNSGLVAVIGKKGSGKSALADVIGLLGNAHTQKDFSFLTAHRFLKPRDNLGPLFQATVRWRSGASETSPLDASTDETLPERVRHIPQNYLETICAEIQESSAPTLFDRELESVIFSHVPEADRLGRGSLQELFGYTAEQTEARIEQLQQKLSQINRDYIELRRGGSSEAKNRVKVELQERQGELDAHRKAKPAEVPDPSGQEATTPESTKAQEELAKVVSEIEDLDEGNAALQKADGSAKRRQAAVERMLARIKNLQATLEEFFQQSAEDAELLDVDPRQLVKLSADSTALLKLRRETEKEIGELADSLDEDHEGSTTRRRKEASARADELRKKLAEPQRRHQEYRRALTNWQKQQRQLEGTVEEAASVKGLEAKLLELDGLPERADAKRAERDAVMREIFAAKTELLDSYRRLYEPVQQFMADHEVAQEVSALSFDAVIAVDGLEDAVLGMIHQGRRGSFQGEHDGRVRLRALIDKHDFSSADGVSAFLEELGEDLSHDRRYEAAPSMEVEDQLMRGATVDGLYDFLFGLRYLTPRFKLLWRGKALDQLSPGERGTLLLIFYLLIDREDIPLVIDQPEENLDNETVAELLVPAVKYAKARRQIILVTHNPNLAVVCDADQIIHARIDKADGNRVVYTSGAIEDPIVTRMIVDVLEGTKPAFDLRDAKYEVLDRA
jgi:ABC-type lipoprotein export system ATPase subunit